MGKLGEPGQPAKIPGMPQYFNPVTPEKDLLKESGADRGPVYFRSTTPSRILSSPVSLPSGRMSRLPKIEVAQPRSHWQPLLVLLVLVPLGLLAGLGANSMR